MVAVNPPRGCHKTISVEVNLPRFTAFDLTSAKHGHMTLNSRYPIASNRLGLLTATYLDKPIASNRLYPQPRTLRQYLFIIRFQKMYKSQSHVGRTPVHNARSF